MAINKKNWISAVQIPNKLPQINLERFSFNASALENFIHETKREINLSNDNPLKNALELSISVAEFEAHNTSKLISKIAKQIDEINISNDRDILLEENSDSELELSFDSEELDLEFEVDTAESQEIDLDENSNNSNSDIALDLYEVQQQELIDLAKSNNNQILTFDDIYSKSNVFKIHPKAVTIGKLVCTCNNICKAKSKAPVFKITERLCESILNLTLLIAKDDNSFSRIISLLSQILYEGSGTNKPLYFQGENTLLSENEYEFILYLQILRKKWIVHNTDRPGANAATSNWQKILEAINWFGLDTLPYTESQFKQLHWNILNKAEDFLLLLASKL